MPSDALMLVSKMDAEAIVRLWKALPHDTQHAVIGYFTKRRGRLDALMTRAFGLDQGPDALMMILGLRLAELTKEFSRSGTPKSRSKHPRPR